MTLLDIMSNSEPEEANGPMRGGNTACRDTQRKHDTPRQIHTVCVHDDTSSFLDDDGRGCDVPAVHPDVIVGVGSTCRHLTHVHRRRPQCTDTETNRKQATNASGRSQHTDTDTAEQHRNTHVSCFQEKPQKKCRRRENAEVRKVEKM